MHSTTQFFTLVLSGHSVPSRSQRRKQDVSTTRLLYLKSSLGMIFQVRKRSLGTNSQEHSSLRH